MKTCSYCGCENPDDAAQCRGCGMKEFVAPAPPTEEDIVETIDDAPEPEPDVLPGEEIALCHHCLFPNLPRAAWCKRCGAPLTGLVVFGPLESIWALGFVLRAAVQGRPKVLVLVGTWLLGLPILAANLFAFFGIFVSGLGIPLGTIYLSLCATSAAVSGAMLFKVTRNYLTIPKLSFDEPGTRPDNPAGSA